MSISLPVSSSMLVVALFLFSSWCTTLALRTNPSALHNAHRSFINWRKLPYLRLADDSTTTISSSSSSRDDSVEYVVGVSSQTTFGALEQIGLNISSELKSRNIIPHHITTASDVFCNREVNMEQITTIGFDMDFTLAQYKVEFDLLAYNGAKDKMVSWIGYPSTVTELQYTQDNTRRGCIIDKKRGNVLKLDQHRYVREAQHGLTPLSKFERKNVYREDYQETETFAGPSFANIDTPFSLVDACLFVQLVDLKDRAVESADATERAFWMKKSYPQLWADLRKCVDRCHKDGVIKLTVAEDPGRYIHYDPNSKFEYDESNPYLI